MTGALVLALPGLLCAVMAWDLSRPRADPSTRDGGRVVDLRQLSVAGVLTAGAGVALAAAVLLPLGAPSPAALPAGVTGVVALVLSLRTPAARPALARVAVPRQAVDPTSRTPTPAPLIASKEPA